MLTNPRNTSLSLNSLATLTTVVCVRPARYSQVRDAILNNVYFLYVSTRVPLPCTEGEGTGACVRLYFPARHVAQDSRNQSRTQGASKHPRRHTQIARPRHVFCFSTVSCQFTGHICSVEHGFSPYATTGADVARVPRAYSTSFCIP